ncbi:unnamed protein product [Musa banksii]
MANCHASLELWEFIISTHQIYFVEGLKVAHMHACIYIAYHMNCPPYFLAASLLSMVVDELFLVVWYACEDCKPQEPGPAMGAGAGAGLADSLRNSAAVPISFVALLSFPCAGAPQPPVLNVAGSAAATGLLHALLLL